MKPTKWINRFLHFTHRERNGLIVFIFLVIAVDLISRYRVDNPTPVPASFFAVVEQVEAELTAKARADSSQNQSFRRIAVRNFDPNSNSERELIERGVPRDVARNIVNYRKAGGEFVTPADVRKIYGVNDSIWSLIRDHIIYPVEKSDHHEKRTELQFEPFDPNTVGYDQLILWGLEEELAQRWIRFREGGKVFQNEDDLSEIYGMTEELLMQILPYVQWNQEFERAKDTVLEPEKKERNRLGINSADSLELIGVPGIGPYSAHKIIEWRTRLGGFYSLDQLSDIYGIRKDNLELMKEYLAVDETLIEKINVNTLNSDQLAEHPYISFAIAEEMVNFRNKYRPFEDLEELRKLYSMDDQLYEKLLPYLELQ